MTSQNADALDFTNTYAASGTLTLSGSKTFTGRTATGDDVFTFELYEGTELLDTQEVKGLNSGTFTFDAIPYFLDPQADPSSNLGEHTYTIREVLPTVNPSEGITYDADGANDYTITVMVADAGDGTLRVTSTGWEILGEAGVFTANGLVFTNTYTAKDVSPAIQISKRLTGRVLDNDEFSFELYAANAFFETNGPALETVTNNDLGQVSFTLIPYTDQDLTSGSNVSTYYYVIKETEPDSKLGGVTYNAENLEIHVIVTVTDDGMGDLAAKVSYSQDTEFNNSYKTANVTPVGIQVSKELSGRALADGEFSFKLYAANDSFAASGDALQTKKNLSGLVTFDPITYTDQDTTVGNNVSSYYYVVKEVDEGLSYIGYDALEVGVTVTVTDQSDGTLKAELAYKDDTVFNNTYTATGTLTLSGEKTFTGRTATGDDMFTFELYEGTELLDTQEVKGLNSGTFTFDAIPYFLDPQADPSSNLGEHTYTIKEVRPTSNPSEGILYDVTEYTFTVEVTDARDGTLNVSSLTQDFTVMGENGEFALDGLDFENIYEASGEFDIQVELDPSKSLAGRALKDQEFSFELKQGDVLIETMKNGPDGVFLFSNIPYTQKDIGKTYTYTISEIPGTETGMYYDDLVITFEVTITDNLDGTLTVVSSTPDDTEFNNRYTAPTPPPMPDYPTISVPFAVRKNLAGRQMSEGEFNFILKDAAGNIIDRASNNSQGDVVFQNRRFSRTGLFLYKVEEVKGDDKHITYDGTSFTLKVNVSASNGRLITRIDYLKDGTPFGGDIAFTNVYGPPKTGDNQPALIIMLSCASLLALLLAYGYKRKKPSPAGSKR